MRPKVMDVQQPDAPIANQMCAAFRCPLRGTISPSNGLGTTYFCRFHYGKEPKENDEVTAKINQYRELIEAAETLRYGHRTFDQIAKRFGWDELCAGIQKNVRGDDIDERIATGYHYGRVTAALVKEIKRGVSGMQEQERGMGGLFNIACPDCRTSIALYERCKIARKQMVERMLQKWGPTEGWEAEPHCGCTKVCVRKQRIKEKE